MNQYRHVFYSWLLSITITLVGLFVYSLVTQNRSHVDPGVVLITLFGSFVVALPSLFIAFIFFRFICSSHLSVYEKFLLWYVLALLAIVLNVLFIPLLFIPELINMELFLEPWPAYAGLVAALTIRYKYFIQFFHYTDQQEQPVTPDFPETNKQTIL